MPIATLALATPPENRHVIAAARPSSVLQAPVLPGRLLQAARRAPSPHRRSSVHPPGPLHIRSLPARVHASRARSGQERSSTSGTRCPLSPCSSSSMSPNSPETRCHRTPPTPGNHLVPSTTVPPGPLSSPGTVCHHPARMRFRTLGLEYGCFQLAYGALASSDGSSAAEHMCLGAGGSKIIPTFWLTYSLNRADSCSCPSAFPRGSQSPVGCIRSAVFRDPILCIQGQLSRKA